MNVKKQVICIDNGSVESYLTEGKIYDVQSEDAFHTGVEDDTHKFHYYYKSRFKDVEVGDSNNDIEVDTGEVYIKCIDNSGVSNDLTNGKVYKVINENGERYVIIDDTDAEFSYMKRRFEIVDPNSLQNSPIKEHSYIELNEVVKSDLKKALDHSAAYFLNLTNNSLQEGNYKAVAEIARILESITSVQNQL